MIQLLFIFITFFFLDNLIPLWWSLQPLVGQYYVVPNVFLTCLVVYVFFESHPRKPYYLALLFGLLYDIFYAGVIGLYPVIFLTAVFVIRRFFVGRTPINLFSMMALMMGVIAASQWVVYFLVLTMTELRMAFLHFVQFILFPTLLFNALFMFVTYPILVNRFRLYRKKYESGRS